MEIEIEEKDKKIYELAVLVKNEEDLAPVIALLRTHNAELLHEPRAKKLSLAYKIEGLTEGVFASCQFRSLPSVAKELENEMNTKNDIVRFLIMIAPPPSAERPMSTEPFPAQRRGRPSATVRPITVSESKPPASHSLSNEALEKKIEEILQ